ncbi:MAG TPA: hypothetical protein VFU76_03340 [Terriglobales bacterium]|nr:hypothetical protein [Terriglobales bacterium]
MNLRTKAIPRALGALLLVSLILSPLFAASNKTPATGHTVDSGTFGIFVNGRRVAAETFHIEQQPGVSIARSELKLEDGKGPAQTAELQLAPNGDLRRYEWKEFSPEKAAAVVQPENDFLVEHVTGTEPATKPIDQPYILPASTMIVDDYFFSHREILAWRYLAGCTPEAGKGCKLTRQQYAVLVPRARSPIVVTIEYAGREKINLKGQQMELDRFDLTADGADWAMWLNPSDHKLMRIVIAADNTEVVRD